VHFRPDIRSGGAGLHNEMRVNACIAICTVELVDLWLSVRSSDQMTVSSFGYCRRDPDGVSGAAAEYERTSSAGWCQGRLSRS